MSMKAIINARILTPEGFKDQQSVLYEHGRILAVCHGDDLPVEAIIERDLEGMTLVPGLIDVQVNGGGGVLFNDCPTVEGIKAIGEAHRRFGTTGFLPTLISADPELMEKGIKAVDDAIMRGIPGVLGIHMEGPFLNEQKRGVHEASKILPLDEAMLDVLCSLKGGRTIVTLAPEKTTSQIIRALRQRGVIVAAGHSQATYEQTLRGLDAGLTGFTHLFNAMRPMQSRDPGMIAAALEDSRAWCSLIADGHHVHPAMLRLAMRAKSDGQIFLITDAMPGVGAKHKGFSLDGEQINVANGQCLTAGGVLAGSDLDMIGAVQNAMDYLDIKLEQALPMASHLPARYLGLQGRLGQIRAGLQADFVLLGPELEVRDSWIKGQAASKR